MDSRKNDDETTEPCEIVVRADSCSHLLCLLLSTRQGRTSQSGHPANPQFARAKIITLAPLTLILAPRKEPENVFSRLARYVPPFIVDFKENENHIKIFKPRIS